MKSRRVRLEGSVDLSSLYITLEAKRLFQKFCLEEYLFAPPDGKVFPYIRVLLGSVLEVLPPWYTIPYAKYARESRFFMGRNWYFVVDKKLEKLRTVFFRRKGMRRWAKKRGSNSIVLFRDE